MELKDIRARAKERMAGFCQVCRVCDGRACAGQVPGMGGVGTGASFQANVAALANLKLNLRTIHGAAKPNLETVLLGRKLALPVLAAPVAGVSFNLGGALSEEDYLRAVLTGCQAAGTVGGWGDGAAETLMAAGLILTREMAGACLPVVKPWAERELRVKLAQVEEAGAAWVGMDIDGAGLITLALMGKPVSPKTPAELKEIIGSTRLKFILKGIMTVDEALLAVETGAAGIVVSNHGGRVMDHTPGTAEVLPAIARAVKGRLAVLVDGGIRSGADVLKMLALGAEAVLVGRPVAVAAMGGGAEGVAKYLLTLRTELVQALTLTGCASLAEVGPRVLFNPPPALA